MAWNSALALDALRNGDLLDLGMSANQIRHNLHPERVVTYELCGRAASSGEGIGEVMPDGGSVDLEQIRYSTYSSVDTLRALLVAQRERFPEVTFYHLAVSKLKDAAGNPLAEALPALHAAGLRSIVMDFDPLRSPSRGELIRLLRATAECDVFVSVTIAMGNSESLEQRIGTLETLRDIQQDSHSIQVARVRVHRTASPDARREEEATAVDYLKMLAVTRIILDNVEHLQADWSVMGPKVLELALRFGADDAGAVPWSQAGSPEPSHHGGESELRRIIRDAGFRPVERDALFRQNFLH
jgi:cyclic dehypoxanthinyl futalosine synthase